MSKRSTSRTLALILVTALIISLVPTAAFATRVSPTPEKLEIPIGATNAAAGDITIEETATTEWGLSNLTATVTISNDGDDATWAARPTVTGTGAVIDSTNVSGSVLTINFHGTSNSGSNEKIAITNIKYAVPAGATKGNVVVAIDMPGAIVDPANTSNATIVDGVAVAAASKAALTATGVNKDAGNIVMVESDDGLFQTGKKITLTLSKAGVTFSRVPTVTEADAGLEIGSGVMSSDSKSVSFTVNHVSDAAATVTFSNIQYDLADTTAQGDIEVGVTTDGTTKINPASVANAELTVSGTISATATSTSVTPGNGRDAGTITLTESAKESFVTTSDLQIVLTNATFQSAPTATATGGIKFLSGGSNVTSAPAELSGPFTTATWDVSAQSTSAGTITISGIKINIAAGATGNVTAAISGAGISGTKTVTIATLSSTSVASVTAASKPGITKTANQAAGDIIITESAAGSFANADTIFVKIFGQNTTDNAIQWSGVPTVSVSSGNIALDAASLEDAFTLRIPINTLSSGSGASTIRISGIKYDLNSKAVDGDVVLDVRVDDDSTVADSARIATVANAAVSATGQVFSDVPTNHWATTYINYMNAQGYMVGYPDSTFRPNNNITRAEFAKIAVIAGGYSLVTTTTASFSDVPTNHWAFQYIETAKANGIIGGYPDGTFRPNSNINRAELAKMIVAAGKLTINTTGTAFPDVPATHWASSYIMTCKNLNIIGGYPDGTFKPANNATRAEASKMVYEWKN